MARTPVGGSDLIFSPGRVQSPSDASVERSLRDLLKAVVVVACLPLALDKKLALKSDTGRVSSCVLNDTLPQDIESVRPRT